MGQSTWGIVSQLKSIAFRFRQLSVFASEWDKRKYEEFSVCQPLHDSSCRPGGPECVCVQCCGLRSKVEATSCGPAYLLRLGYWVPGRTGPLPLDVSLSAVSRLRLHIRPHCPSRVGQGVDA